MSASDTGHGFQGFMEGLMCPMFFQLILSMSLNPAMSDEIICHGRFIQRVNDATLGSLLPVSRRTFASAVAAVLRRAGRRVHQYLLWIRYETRNWPDNCKRSEADR